MNHLVASLVDTNILVYCHDPFESAKRGLAHELLRKGAAEDALRLPHQAMAEFVHAVTKGRARGQPFLSREQAWRQAEDFLNAFPVLYPNESVFRTALLGMAAYKFSWYEAHLWAYAEHYRLPEILSEDFQDGRMYGTVRIRNPFVALGPRRVQE
jgi:predicted nucleic acid-binding protein